MLSRAWYVGALAGMFAVSALVVGIASAWQDPAVGVLVLLTLGAVAVCFVDRMYLWAARWWSR